MLFLHTFIVFSRIQLELFCNSEDASPHIQVVSFIQISVGDIPSISQMCIGNSVGLDKGVTTPSQGFSCEDHTWVKISTSFSDHVHSVFAIFSSCIKTHSALQHKFKF